MLRSIHELQVRCARRDAHAGDAIADEKVADAATPSWSTFSPYHYVGKAPQVALAVRDDAAYGGRRTSQVDMPAALLAEQERSRYCKAPFCDVN